MTRTLHAVCVAVCWIFGTEFDVIGRLPAADVGGGGGGDGGGSAIRLAGRTANALDARAEASQSHVRPPIKTDKYSDLLLA